MIETFNSLMMGFSVAFQPEVLMYAFFGCIIGTLVGMMPGLGPLAGISLLLPATFGLNPIIAIVLTLCAVFVPIAFLGGLTGELYRQFAVTISIAVVISGNQMLYKFGPDAPIVKAIGQARWPRQEPGDSIPDWIPQLSSHFWVMVLMALWVGYVFHFRPFGRHLFAIGGNENAARLTGVPVDWIKFQAYVFSAFTASIASMPAPGSAITSAAALPPMSPLSPKY